MNISDSVVHCEQTTGILLRQCKGGDNVKQYIAFAASSTMSDTIANPIFFVAWLIPVVTIGLVALVCHGIDKKKQSTVASLPTP
ncbi:MAG: hypothetical protein EOO38_19530 [Cytophagaceae bacterium]|nr:MAG: hypothetical protein EOO38_19530 [Cytophagaceae bacterium]